MSFSNGPGIITNGLVLNLNAGDRNSYVSGSTTWRDISGNGNNGTLTNGPTFSSGNGGSIVLNGSNNYVDVGSSGIVNYSLPFTVSLWLYITRMQSNFTAPFTFRTNTGGNFIILIGVDSYKGTVVATGASPVGKTDTDASFFLNNWVNVSVTFNGSNNFIVYENAVQKTLSGGVGGLFDPGQNTILGWVNSSNALQGNIAIAQFYNIQLGLTQIQQNYNAIKSRFGLK